MEGTIGEIRMFGGNFAPRTWAFCEGQILAISQFDALFSIVGTTYGGDGRTTFALPDLRGRTAIGAGHGPGLSNRIAGQRLGTEVETLSINQLPHHTHVGSITAPGYTASVKPQASSGGRGVTTTNTPINNFPAPSPDGTNIYADTANAEMGESNVTINPDPAQPGGVTILPAGGSNYHNNLQPTSVINYIICLTGIFPSRN